MAPASQLPSTSPQEWIALLGRRDEPTDGVADYCTFLAGALAPHNVTLRQVRVEWNTRGWRAAIRALRRDSQSWEGQRVILQYTAMAWSKRGFPVGALRALSALHGAGARVAVMFHEPGRQGDGTRPIDRIRGAYQDYVVRHLYTGAEKALFADPLSHVAWLPAGAAKAAFIPIGANIPDSPAGLAPSASNSSPRTVCVFCVSDPPYRRLEVEDIAHAVRVAAERGLSLRLVLVGKGTIEAKEALTAALQGVGVETSFMGLQSAEVVSRTLAASDVMLCVRGKLYPRRGSALAGIACGLPLIGFAGEAEGTPLEQAGIVLVPWGNRDALAEALVKVLSDPDYAQQLRARSVRAHVECFSWERIASQMVKVLGVTT